MLLILPLWTWLIASGLAGVAIVGLPVPADTGCVLRKNSGPHQAIGMLATLTDLFGEKLMTKSNEKMYYVSICRSIPLNDTTSLAGAVKYNSNGEYVVLGEIDQAEVVVNEEIIVLTYNGSEVNTNLNDECHGNRWKTQLTLMCDPYAIKDTLKLVDEDLDQSEICQIKFEILTLKICRRNSSVVIRTPIIQDKYNNLPLVINRSHINNTQYNNNNSNNRNIVNNINENIFKNYRHYGFAYIQNNSKQPKLHQDDSSNYIREPYFKRRLMMNTEIPTLVKQSSQNLSQGIDEVNDELTSIFVKLIETFIPKPIFVIGMVALTVYYRCFSTFESIVGKRKKSQPSKNAPSLKASHRNHRKNRGKPKKNRRRSQMSCKTLSDVCEVTISVPIKETDNTSYVSGESDDLKHSDQQEFKEGKPDDYLIGSKQCGMDIGLGDEVVDLDLSVVEIDEKNEQEGEDEFIGDDNADVEVNNPDHYEGKEKDNVSQGATRHFFLKIIWKPIWIVIGLVVIAIIMLILDIPLGSFIFCILWIWCMFKLCKPGQKKKKIDENTPLIPDKDTSNERETQNEGVFPIIFEEEIAPPVETRPTAVYDEQNKSVEVWIADETEDSAKVSGESNIQKESDDPVPKEGTSDGSHIDLDKGMSVPFHLSQVATGSTAVHSEQSTPAGTSTTEDKTDISGESALGQITRNY
ncbi:uncharacterized protein LOC126838616 isoform X3 [Adelges cooleyi]|uniref:uncharacterized protein LOC126838616 isoform X3 n=1 Tax=Adelges cooleyi TaxID=133065 RepID=UPI00217F7689|nr:uncharacterized protein LOC126838616 isoform X3 [Adelges cooleyi]